MTTSRRELLPLIVRSLESLAGISQITTPDPCFAIRQIDIGQSLGQIASDANFLAVGTRGSPFFKSTNVTFW